MRSEKYIIEKFVKGPYGYSYVATPIIEEIIKIKSNYQEIKVVKTPFGKTLVLDGIIQLTEYDEQLYHEALVKPSYKKTFRNILILGGGDGGAARELIKINPDTHITIVDIDPMVTEIIEKYLPEVPKGIFTRKNVKLINSDAWKYVENTHEKYHYILVDLTDIREEDNQVNRFYQKKFMNLLSKILKKDGRIVYFLGLYPVDINIIEKFLKDAEMAYKHYKIYGRYIPSFGGIWTYITLSNKPIKLKRVNGVIDLTHNINKAKIKI